MGAQMINRSPGRRKQRGFLYFVTGANGTGKTLNTLKWVRDRQLKENRPVAYNGRFDMVEGGELSSWKKIEAKDWQLEPDGTIFLIDEAHNDFPTRGTGTPPDYVAKMAEHRKRGFDFYLISQHPNNIDSFVRRLVGAPGWHRHLKRSGGIDMVSVLEWSAIKSDCEKTGSGKDAQVTMVPFPKQVYGWYKSAVLHTGKKKIPRAVWVLLACVILVPLMGWFAASRLMSMGDRAKATPGAVQPGQPLQTASAVSPVGGSAANRVLTTAEYVDQYRPRIAGLVHTSPAYDALTQPSAVPVPAACVQSKKQGCKCYTQQGTPYATTVDICEQVVAGGFFMAFDPKGSAPVQQVASLDVALMAPQRPMAQARPQPLAQVAQATQQPASPSEGATTRAGRFPMAGYMGPDFNLPPSDETTHDGDWMPGLARNLGGQRIERERYSTPNDIVRTYGG